MGRPRDGGALGMGVSMQLVREPSFHFTVDVDGETLRHVAIVDLVEEGTIAVSTWLETVEGDSAKVTEIIEAPDGYAVGRKSSLLGTGGWVTVTIDGQTRRF